ncbi:coenzyme F390 synthetase [Methanoculleus sp. 7T]|jgi:coenzyme F390 synthetase|uniref:coenzyme F390 synthetase n=1 Tax=Methanoculleus sp. 7T TaxID=2937282 RepID=UPI0020C00A0D|nr:coenzyme F390 synthetase [Methanoculleus sp. 7T]MCK8518563.1 coenzyme F390 synthetase [Methanoculleus sp. 7T]
MADGRYHNPAVETLARPDLDVLIDERVRYTVGYADEHSPFYRRWFERHGIRPAAVREHEDLRDLPIVSGATIRRYQPPQAGEFCFKSVPWEAVFTINETSGTSGVPKSFFLTWEDWERYAEKYSRIFVSQGFRAGDRVVVCTSYGMNVGANTMTLAARDLGMTIVPEGKCTFPVRVMAHYRPTAVIGSVFKLLRLARRMEAEGLAPRDAGVARLVVGGESFAPESRRYLEEVWGCPVYNTYGSTEGTMCGECIHQAGLHVPEDLVHFDLYDPRMERFVPDGETGRLVYTTLLAPGERAGTLLINYDTEDTCSVLSRERCRCGRTHMRIDYPRREAETFRIGEVPLTRVDLEAAVFQPENMVSLNGEYEAFIYGGDEAGETVLRVSMECVDPARVDPAAVEETFLTALFRSAPGLSAAYEDGSLRILCNVIPPGGLELHRAPGRPKRIVDRR